MTRPVVLCHGFPEPAYSWHQQIPALADVRVIALDRRGYGGSDAPEPVGAPFRLQPGRGRDLRQVVPAMSRRASLGQAAPRSKLGRGYVL